LAADTGADAAAGLAGGGGGGGAAVALWQGGGPLRAGQGGEASAGLVSSSRQGRLSSSLYFLYLLILCVSMNYLLSSTFKEV